MPTGIEHIRQAKNNAKFLAAIQPDPAAQYPDWVITVAFYVVLHLVEAKFARVNIHCTDHHERDQKVAQELPAISGKYLRLYSESRAARYDCGEIKPERAQHLLQTVFNPVREHLCHLLRTQL